MLPHDVSAPSPRSRLALAGGFALLVIACLLLTTIATYLPASQAFDLNSDQLTIPSLFWDLTHRGLRQLATWQLSRAPYLFPDILIYFAIGSLVPNTLNQIFIACLIPFTAWICIAGHTVARATARPWLHGAIVMLLLEGLMTWLLAGTRYESLLMYRFGMANHFTALVAAFALFNLIAPPATDGTRPYAARRAAAVLLIPLLTLSDQSFAVYYVGPIGVVLLDAGLNRTIPFRRMLLLGLEQAVPAAAIVLFGRRLLEHFVALQPVPNFDPSLIIIGFAHMLVIIPHDPLMIVAFWLPLTAALLYNLRTIISRATPLGAAEPATRRRMTMLFCLCSTMLTLLVTGELYDQLGHMLYLTPVMENPLIAAAIAVTPLLAPRLLGVLLPGFAAAVLAVYLSIVLRAHDLRQPLVALSETSRRELAACVRDHQLTAGLAHYGLARYMMAMLDWKLPMGQLWPDHPSLFYWGSNLDWYSQAITAPLTNAYPAYNFIVLDRYKDAEVIDAFGRWNSEFTCAGIRFAKYDNPAALSAEVDGWLAQIDGRFTPKPGQTALIPLRAFHSLVGHNTELGWEAAPGTPAGFLTFGPYLPFDAGDYKIIVTLSAQGLNDQSHIDVVSNNGGRQIASQPIPASAAGTFDLAMAGTLPRPVLDVEIRTYYGGQGSLRVEKVVVQRGEK